MIVLLAVLGGSQLPSGLPALQRWQSRCARPGPNGLCVETIRQRHERVETVVIHDIVFDCEDEADEEGTRSNHGRLSDRRQLP